MTHGSKIITHSIALNILKMQHEIKMQERHLIRIWIPSHIGLVGNERADMLAKEELLLLQK